MSQALAALRWNLVVRLGGQAITWVITIYVMRLLQPADYGLLAMAAVFLEYVSTVSELGLGAAIIQASEISERKLRVALGLIVIVNGAAALLFFLSAPLIAGFYHEARLTAIVRTLSLQFLLTGAILVPQSLAYRKLDLKHISIVQVGSTILGGLVTIALASSGAGVWALVTGYLIGAALQLVGMHVVSPFLHLPLFSLKESRGLLSFGGKVTGVRLLWSFWSDADILIAGRVLGKTPLGGYSVAKQLAALPLAKTAGIVTQVAFPAFSRLQKDPESMRAHLLRSLELLALLVFPVTWGISCIAPELIEVVLGRAWLLAVLPLQILGVVMSIRLLSQFTSAVLLAAGRPDLDLRNALVYTLLLPGSFLIGSQWGLLGLSLVWVLVFPVAFLVTMRASLTALGVTLRSVWHAAAWPTVSAGSMYACTALVRWLMGETLGPAPRMALLVAAGAVVYCGLLLTFDRSGVQSAMRLVRTVVWGGGGERG